jgi:hypothetical protein
MTKKHYIQLAADLRVNWYMDVDQSSKNEVKTFMLVLETIAQNLKRENSAFNKERFFDAVLTKK